MYSITPFGETLVPKVSGRATVVRVVASSGWVFGPLRIGKAWKADSAPIKNPLTAFRVRRAVVTTFFNLEEVIVKGLVNRPTICLDVAVTWQGSRIGNRWASVGLAVNTVVASTG